MEQDQVYQRQLRREMHRARKVGKNERDRGYIASGALAGSAAVIAPAVADIASGGKVSKAVAKKVGRGAAKLGRIVGRRRSGIVDLAAPLTGHQFESAMASRLRQKEEIAKARRLGHLQGSKAARKPGDRRKAAAKGAAAGALIAGTAVPWAPVYAAGMASDIAKAGKGVFREAKARALQPERFARAAKGQVVRRGAKLLLTHAADRLHRLASLNEGCMVFFAINEDPRARNKLGQFSDSAAASGVDPATTTAAYQKRKRKRLLPAKVPVHGPGTPISIGTTRPTATT